MELDITQILLQGGASSLITLIFIVYLILDKRQDKKKNGNGKTDNNQNVLMARLEERLKTIETNHLPHIEKRMERIENKQDLLLEKIMLLLVK